MNSNYEWNKQYTRGRLQSRYHEAGLFRKTKQSRGEKQRSWQLFKLPDRLTAFIHKLTSRYEGPTRFIQQPYDATITVLRSNSETQPLVNTTLLVIIRHRTL
jgi:hypothetical protein